MATKKDSLFGAAVNQDAQIRVIAEHDGVSIKTFDNVAGAPKLPVGTPVVFNTSTNFWQVYDQGATNGTGDIRGIVYPEAIQLDAADEVQGSVLTHGSVDARDVNTSTIRGFLTGSPSEAQLNTALRDPGVRDRGLKVKGLSQVR